jgi:hypothetical protein
MDTAHRLIDIINQECVSVSNDLRLGRVFFFLPEYQSSWFF